MANAQRNQQGKSKSVAGNAAPPVAATAKPATSAIAERAYAIWQQRGCPHGKDQEHWFQAESELRQRKN